VDEDVLQAAMAPFGLLAGDVRKVRKGEKELWVVEPQAYDFVSRFRQDNEAIQKDYFGLDELPDDATVTTGDGAGFGDPWFRATPKMEQALLKRFHEELGQATQLAAAKGTAPRGRDSRASQPRRRSPSL
jgi:hypothetical protein